MHLIFVVLAFGVFALEFDGRIWDHRLWGKVGECPVGRGLSAELAVVLTEYGCSSVSCARDFLLKSLKDDFLALIV